MSANELFIVGCIGTSLQAETHAHRYHEEVRQRLALLTSKSVQFVNLAKAGNASQTILAEQLPVMVRLRPHAVLIDSSMNDFQQLSRPAAYANVTAIVEAMKAVTPPQNVFLMTMSTTYLPPPATATLESFYDDYRQIAIEQGVQLIDNYPDWKAAQPGDHPNPPGHPTLQGVRRVLIPNVTAALTPLVS